MDLLKLVVGLWLTGVAMSAVARLLRGDRHTALFCLMVHWMFFGVPLLLDVFQGMPTYTLGRTLAIAANDPTTTLIYLAHVSIIPLLLLAVGTKRLVGAPHRAVPLALDTQPIPDDQSRGPVWPLHVALGLPLLAVLTAPQPTLYLTYNFYRDAEGGGIDSFTSAWHSLVQLSVVLAVIAAALIVRRARSLILSLVVTFPWVLTAMYFSGKRHIIAFYLAVLTRSLWDRGALGGARLPILATVLAAGMIAFSLGYQSMVRGIDADRDSRMDFYENLRLDYSRDHSLKLAIHAELQDRPILAHRGESLLFYAGMYVPRRAWPDKPLPYAVRHTCYALDIAPPRLLGWGMTTSIFDEAIANAGWLGMLLGPILLGWCCRMTDRSASSLLRIMGMLVCVLMVVVHIAAFMPLLLIWLGGSLWERHRRFFTLHPAMGVHVGGPAGAGSGSAAVRAPSSQPGGTEP